MSRQSFPETRVMASVTDVTASGTAPGIIINAGEGVFYLDATQVEFDGETQPTAGQETTLDVTIEERDLTSGKWFTVLTFAQKTDIGTERLISPSPANNVAPYPGGLPGLSYRVAYKIGGALPLVSFTVGFSGLTTN